MINDSILKSYNDLTIIIFIYKMDIFKNCNKLFIDFDGVIVDSNNFKELAIKKSIFQLMGNNQLSIKAIEYFNINAGISRKYKLSLFFKAKDVSEIMKLYALECKDFLLKAKPNNFLKEFLNSIEEKHNKIKIYILSGGEKEEIEFFLKKNNLIGFFKDIFGSNKNKIEHLRNNQVSENDIFIGDSQNDLKASLESGIKFILFEEYKSLKSYPSKELINNNVFLKTKNFESLIKYISQ